MAVAAGLSTIRDKVRLITGRYTPESLSDDAIDNYINNFYLYNLPDTLRTFRLRVPYNILTVPNQDTYNFPFELYNSCEPSAYVGGYNLRWFQSREQFYALWPKLKQVVQVGVSNSFDITNIVAGATTDVTAAGNNFEVGELVSFADVVGMTEINDLTGTVTVSGDTFTVSIDSSTFTAYVSGGTVSSNTFTGTIEQTPFLRAQVASASGDTTEPDGEVQISNVFIIMQPPGGGTPIVASDTSFSGNIGDLTGTGIDSGFVDYLTGEFSVTYNLAPPSSAVFTAQFTNYGASRPICILFFNNQFTLRPVPDKVYQIEMVAYKTPTQLIEEDQDPALREWWMLLAYGASSLVYSDFPDPEGMAHAKSLLQEQIDMMETRTVKQLGNERAATLISAAASPNYLGMFIPNQNF